MITAYCESGPYPVPEVEITSYAPGLRFEAYRGGGYTLIAFRDDKPIGWARLENIAPECLNVCEFMRRRDATPDNGYRP